MDTGSVHRDFADWYRVVSLDPRPELLLQRWKAIEAFTNDASVLDILDLTRIFYALKPKQDTLLERLRTGFKATDESFPMRGNDAELQVLAGAALVDFLRHSDGWNWAAALALVVAGFGSHRKSIVAAIPSLAANHLTKASAELRSKKLKAPISSEFVPKLKEVQTALQSNQMPSVAEPLNLTLTAASNAIQQLMEWAADVSTQEALRTEESQILWWLFGGHSRDLDTRFSKLAEPSAILISAKELSDLTLAMPGPLSARAFLDVVIKSAHPDLQGGQSLLDTVSACTLDWQRSLITISGLGDVDELCPIHCAVARSVDAGGKKAWQAAYSSVTRLKASDKFQALDLSHQVYRERLLLRAVDLLRVK
jgi:hypothetical protein